MGPDGHAATVVAVQVARRLVVVVVVWALAALAAPALADEPARQSLPVQDDRAAWRSPGFRLELGVAYGRLFGMDGAPGGRLLGPLLRVGVRLDESWSLMGSFQYLSASADGGLSGLRYAGTVEPVWHVAGGLSLALGLGFGGIAEGRTARPNPEPLPSTLEDSYTFPDAHHPLASCTGVGVASLVRIDYRFILGPRSATGLTLEGLGQWTGCEDETGRVEPDSAAPIVRRQWWPHLGLSLSWQIAWR